MTGVQTCALPILPTLSQRGSRDPRREARARFHGCSFAMGCYVEGDPPGSGSVSVVRGYLVRAGSVLLGPMAGSFDAVEGLTGGQEIRRNEQEEFRRVSA